MAGMKVGKMVEMMGTRRAEKMVETLAGQMVVKTVVWMVVW